MKVNHFHVPGEATRREYSVYLVVARHRTTKMVRIYVGKTGDNREGCNHRIRPRVSSQEDFFTRSKQTRYSKRSKPESSGADARCTKRYVPWHVHRAGRRLDFRQ